MEIFHKKCGKCKIEKILEYFHKSKQSKDGLFIWCKDCVKKYNQSPKRKQYYRNYDKKPEVIEKKRRQNKLPERKQYRKNWRKTIKGKRLNKKYKQTQKYKNYMIKYNQRPKVKESKKLWKQNNLEKVKAQDHKRRAIMINAPGEWTDKHINEMFIIQEGKCCFCKNIFIPTKRCKKGYHIEHKIPLSRGGTNWPKNICLACPNCNHKKYMKTDEEFIKILREENEAKTIEIKVEEFVESILFKKSS